MLSVSVCFPSAYALPPSHIGKMLTVSVVFKSVMYPIATPRQILRYAVKTRSDAHVSMFTRSSCRYCWRARPWSATLLRLIGSCR